jgi:hypothetical protein
MEILEKTDEYWMNISIVDEIQNREKGSLRVGGFFGDDNDGKGKWRYVDSEYRIELNTWTHVACRYDLDSLLIFINGSKEKGIPIPENFTAIKEDKLALGCKYTRDDEVQAQFHGRLDEITIWDKSLTESEIQDLMYSSVRGSHLLWDNLIAYYKFDEDNLGLLEGTVVDEKGIHDGDNRGAKWVTNSITDIFDEKLSNDSEFAIHQNYPNPFNPSTIINYFLSSTAKVRISVYDILGTEIAVLVNEVKPQGEHSVEFNAESLNKRISSGMYFYRMTANDFSRTKRMLLVK